MSGFENIIIGSAHEGSSELFAAEDQQMSSEELAVKRKEKGILENVSQSFESTLEYAGYEQVREIGGGIQYPTIDQWINHRISFDRGTKFFPCFLKNKEGKIFFAKVKISNDPSADDRLKREFDILKHLPAGVRVPKPEVYLPGDDRNLSLLIIEMIPFSEAGVRDSSEWKKEHALNVASQIKILESQKQEETDVDNNDTEEPVDFAGECEQLLVRAGETLDPLLAAKVKDVILRYKSINRTVLVHGDLATKNVLIGKDEKAILVDWELSSTHGFLGQDAAKIWSSLSGEPRKALAESYALAESGKADEERKIALQFGVITENLVHLAWRNENIISKGKEGESPNLAIDIENYNNNIREILSI